MDLMFIALIGSVAALVISGFFIANLLKRNQGNDKLKEVSASIQEGAQTYLLHQLKLIGIFFSIIFVFLCLLTWIIPLLNGGDYWLSPFIPFAFLTGGIFSGLCGYICMLVTTQANARVVSSAAQNFNAGYKLTLHASSIIALTILGAGLFNLVIWYIIIRYGYNIPQKQIPSILITFGLGASIITFIARLGGSILTKASELTGKMNNDLPENDLKNPTSIIDKLGEIIGASLDLYETYVASIVAAMILGAFAALNTSVKIGIHHFIQLPALIATAGILYLILNIFLMGNKDESSPKKLSAFLNRGIYFNAALIVILTGLYIYYFMGFANFGIYWSIPIGLLIGLIIQYFSEYFTSSQNTPIKALIQNAQNDTPILMMSGLTTGIYSTIIPAVTIIGGVLGSFYLAPRGFGLYSIGLMAMGMLSTLGTTLYNHIYGIFTVNANRIAVLAQSTPDTLKRTTQLQESGNTNVITGKAYTIMGGVVTSIALLAAFGNKIIESLKLDMNHQTIWDIASVQLEDLGYRSFVYFKNGLYILSINILDPIIFIGLLIGILLPFIFSAMTVSSIYKITQIMIDEAKKKKDGTDVKDKPNYKKYARICADSINSKITLPLVMTLIIPVVIGILAGPAVVVAVLAGSLISTFILGMITTISGCSWNTVKTAIESEQTSSKDNKSLIPAVHCNIAGNIYKDAVGPCLNVFMKVLMIVSIVFAATFTGLNILIIQGIQSFFNI